MLRDISYALVFGKPLVLWIGLAAFVLFLAALSVVALNNYTRIRIPIEWHNRLAISGLVIALIHVTLVILAYFF